VTGVPLCRASQVLPFSSWLEKHGGPAFFLLRSVGLPSQPEEIANRWIAELPIWRLCEVATRSQGIADFGLRVGLETDVAEIGAFGRALRAAATLRQALETFLSELNAHSSSAAFGLRPGGRLESRLTRSQPQASEVRQLAGESVWFWRQGIPGFECEPVEQYVLGFVVQILRLAAGARWAPDRILLQAGGLPGELAAETFAETRIQLRAPVTAVRFPASLLSLPLRSPAPDASGALERLRSDAPAEDLAGALRQALESVLPDRLPDMQWAADVANTSPRTLRRRLRELGLSWSDLVEQTRFDTARHLLETSDLKLRAVAREVGYSDPANFSRAFRRWTGVAPSGYRPEGERAEHAGERQS
jgi:AraC-like DNA-binding protein